MKTHLQELKGQVFGRLTLVKFSHVCSSNLPYWVTHCICGTFHTVRLTHLRRGAIKSCGCFAKEQTSKRHKTHGQSETTEYNIWLSMKGRCLNTRNHAYMNYGGRGIIICRAWLNSFEAFLQGMGKRPTGLTLERVDNSKGYYKQNCIWAT